MNEETNYPVTQNARDIHQPDEPLNALGDLADYFRQYARERPEVVALWCLGIGFVLGWKLKPW